MKSNQTIYLGADHGGFPLKNQVKDWLQGQGYQVQDLGAKTLDPSDDYPVFAKKVGVAVAKDSTALGILFCRSGAGMAIAANKVKRVRAAEAWNQTSAAHARQHNQANIISLGADWLTLDDTKKIIQAYLAAEPDTAPRHLRRLNLIKQIESSSL
ncbi:MAG: RpiB/LacA/LacB family sugar-phosphate isomerase [Candidatus Pacebacteria bacterium]|nr:RpiB/LacA/LacB family sugar-phosphate isomerase [Candidatus Paceibacterota bacterium]